MVPFVIIFYMEEIEEPRNMINAFEKENNFDTPLFDFFSSVTHDIFYKDVDNANTNANSAIDKISKSFIRENNNNILLSNYGENYFND